MPSGSGLPAATTEEVAIGKYLRGAWAAFAKDPKEGLKGYGGGWPLYDPGKDTLVRLAYQNETGLNVTSPSVYDVGCVKTVPVNSTGSESGGSSTSGTPTTSSSATGTPSASVTEAASPSASTGEGSRVGVSLGMVVLAAAVVACCY